MMKAAEIFPPGETIQEELEARGWTQEDLVEITKTDRALVSGIVTGKRAITADTAELLARAFGTSAELWINLEFQYRRSLQKRKVDPDVELRAKLFAKAPIREMQKRGWVSATKETAKLVPEILEFYGRTSLDEAFVFDHAARKSSSYKETTPSQSAWLHRARQMAEVLQVKHTWRPSRASELIRELQRLVLSAAAVQEVPRVMSEFGVRFVVVEPLPQGKIDGASFWINDDRDPVIAIALRYDRIDNFWHTTMHECAHIKNRDGVSVDAEVLSDRDDKPEAERLADEFAVSSLIAQDELEDFCVRSAPLYSKVKIFGFAQRLRIHPGIVVGQLHHRGPDRRGLDWKYFRPMLVPIRKLVTETAMTDGWGKTVPL